MESSSLLFFTSADRVTRVPDTVDPGSEWTFERQVGERAFDGRRPFQPTCWEFRSADSWVVTGCWVHAPDEEEAALIVLYWPGKSDGLAARELEVPRSVLHWPDRVTLRVRNIGPRSLPFGARLHGLSLPSSPSP